MQDVAVAAASTPIQARRRADDGQFLGGADVVGLSSEDDLVRASRRSDVREFGDPNERVRAGLERADSNQPSSSPRTSGIISGRGTSPSEAVYVSFATPTGPFHIRASTGTPYRLLTRSPHPATGAEVVSVD